MKIKYIISAVALVAVAAGGVTLYKKIKAGIFDEKIAEWNDILNPEVIDEEELDEYRAVREAEEVAAERDNNESVIAVDEDDIPEWPKGGSHDESDPVVYDAKNARGEGLDTEAHDYTLYSKPECEDKEEDVEQLRYEPNSDEAMNQYVNMRLADISPASPSRDLLSYLFRYVFEPTTEADHTVAMHIQEERHKFFGKSRWTNIASIAELFLHYGELADYDMDGGVQDYVESYLRNVGITLETPDNELPKIIDDLINHQLFGKNGFGMFALTPTSNAFGIQGFQVQYNAWIEELLDEETEELTIDEVGYDDPDSMI